MCPGCIASAAWAVAGITSTSGLAVLTVKKLRLKSVAKKTPLQPKSKEKSS
jgi:hypothetical protein